MKIYFSKFEEPDNCDVEDPGPLLPPRTVLLPPEDVPDRFRVDRLAMDEWIATTGLIELKQRGLTFHLEPIENANT